MTASPLNGAQRRAAKVAGLAYLLSFVTVASVNFGIFARLIVGDDPAQSARNVLAHETLFRVGLAGFVFYCVAVFVLSAALYVALKPVGQNLALLAAFGRLIQGLTWLILTLNLFTALRLLSSPEYARVFQPDQLAVLARPYLTGFDYYYVGLIFWSLAATLGAYLWFKSGYVPKALAAFGVMASAWCAACAFALLLFPDFPKVVNLWWFDMPMALFEIALGFLLVFRATTPTSHPCSRACAAE